MTGAFSGGLALALVAGALTGGGVLLLIVAIRGVRPRPGRPSTRSREEIIRTLTTRTALAVVVGVLVLIITRWPVAGVGAALLVLGWNSIGGGAAEERRSMARLEALAAWTESLRDTIAGAVGLEQAIPSSLRAVAPVLRPKVQALVDRLHTRVPLADGLRMFGDDLDDASADLVVAALILNARLRGPGLRDMLGALADSARAELDMRRRVEANRRTTRRSVQIVVGVSVGTALLLAVVNRTYVAMYDSLTGQLVLAVVVGLFAVGFIWLRRLAKYETPQRFLASADSDKPEAPDKPGVPGEVPETVARWQGQTPANGSPTVPGPRGGTR
ncbi:type II secretion system F family protein [Actinoallomurus iriomotensis]|uniref:Type II secretion system protein n=1 Tax=Actinoallomurus iriomotensis TaxID=478107 RepID=A0A9W6S903_9ACTN|nr:type II secretion system F family protein [Actinoallomurus iriomotensis]GLY89249.1 type II secretion system protein [Actinoallomurus iriomotensis]